LRGGSEGLRDFLQWLFFPWIQCFPWAAPLLLDGVVLEIREVARAGLPYLSRLPIRLKIKIIGEMQTPAPVSFVVLKANQATVVVTVGAGAVE